MNAPVKKISVERLHQAFSYDPLTGVLFRKEHAGNVAAGPVKGSPDAKKHLRVQIDKKRLQIHNIAWALMTGYWPSLVIDHRNGNPADNRWSNLRLATNQQNSFNQRLPKHNTTGFKGVVATTSGKWAAGIKVDGVRAHLGTFDTREAAAEKYQQAAKAAFGEFYREK